MNEMARRVTLVALFVGAALIVALAVWALWRPVQHPTTPRDAILVDRPPACGKSPPETLPPAEHAPGGDALVDVVKVLELVGDSPTGWQEAVENAVREASKTVRGITGVEVYNLTANVQDGRVVEYKANVKVAFAVEGSRSGR